MHEAELKKKLAQNQQQAAANAEALAELARRAAELAEQVPGREEPDRKVLDIDVSGSTSLSPEPDTSLTPDTPEKSENTSSTNPAADLIRQKLDRLYGREPSAVEEAAESIALKSHRSKHQQFMYELTTSGKPLAEIQTAWHNYYVALPDMEKHQVWQEFYENQSSVSRFAQATAKELKAAKPKTAPAVKSASGATTDTRSFGEIKAQILDKVSAGGRLKASHHVKSALFGLGLAAGVGMFIGLVFFNQVFVAPFISPSRSVSATPIIGSSSDVGPEPKVIIPKINLEVPVVYGLNTVEESAIQNALEDGVVHFAASPEPGEKGNVVIVGHSSNNILNSGRYKFAFVLLKRLETDDTFFLHKDGKRYTYKIYEKKIVSPTEVSVLGPADRPNTVTLITCDPPGTSINRLIVVAEQIDPDPNTNKPATTEIELQTTQQLPSAAPSLWSRFFN